MKRSNLMRYGLTVLTASTAMSVAVPAPAQQINGTPGSPSATQVINGNQIPPPPLPFGGVIKETAAGFQALLAAARRAAQGRAEHPAHHDR